MLRSDIWGHPALDRNDQDSPWLRSAWGCSWLNGAHSSHEATAAEAPSSHRSPAKGNLRGHPGAATLVM